MTSPYRTHTCAELRAQHAGHNVRLCGWLHAKRDHGQLLFIDLRDHYGLTQCIAETDHLLALDNVRLESVLKISGHVVARDPETVNPKLPTGAIEVRIVDLEILSLADPLPLQVAGDEIANEETRLRYRYLDLRRDSVHRAIMLRGHIIHSLRHRMIQQGFAEFQTPILTVSSPEGARDFLVPSRLHQGKFYALPQAPQLFKQFLMIAGFDRYFQIAPCFRDEDSRADRSPGEFYQLDFEMSFVTQEDVFAAIEPVLHGLFQEFSSWDVTPYPFPRLSYQTAQELYGTDKPDLRNPLISVDVSDIFRRPDVTLRVFRVLLDGGGVVKAIRAPDCARQPRRFFDKLSEWSQEIGASGLGYIVRQEGQAKGPLVKFLSQEAQSLLFERVSLLEGDAVFFIAEQKPVAQRLAALVRTRLATDLDLIEPNAFRFCWITDFPLYETDDNGHIQFSHNPFSMPQGGLHALETQDPLSIKAYQYDIVCNGVELSSGAIRNHSPKIMAKAFEIAGYTQEYLETHFGGMLTALKYGAPPHGGCAPGIERIVMLLANQPNLREVIAFPFNQRAEDLMLGAPTEVDPSRLKELHIDLSKKTTPYSSENKTS